MPGSEDLRRINHVWYKLIRMLCRAYLQMTHPVLLIDVHKMPQGPFVLFSNHRGNSDIPVVSMLSDQPMYFWAKSDMLEKQYLGRTWDWLWSRLGAISTPKQNLLRDRSIDKAIKRMMIDRLEAHTKQAVDRGYSLVIFPEGTRKDVDIIEIERGPLNTAQMLGIPLVIVGIHGTHKQSDKTRYPQSTIVALVHKVILPEDLLSMTKKELEEVMTDAAEIASWRNRDIRLAPRYVRRR